MGNGSLNIDLLNASERARDEGLHFSFHFGRAAYGHSVELSWVRDSKGHTGWIDLK